jgi:hypothetical protein
MDRKKNHHASQINVFKKLARNSLTRSGNNEVPPMVPSFIP